jgi:hypothetical protein
MRKLFRHAAFALDPILEGDADQVAFQVVAPGMIHAAKGPLFSPMLIKTDERATMRAAIFESIDLSISVTGDDDGGLTHETGAEIAGMRDFDFEAQIRPAISLEDALLLVAVDVFTLERPIGHTGEAWRPGERFSGCGMRLDIARHALSSRFPVARYALFW